MSILLQGVKAKISGRHCDRFLALFAVDSMPISSQSFSNDDLYDCTSKRTMSPYAQLPSR